MDLLMSSIFTEKNIIIDNFKEPSVLMGMCEESLKYVEDVEPRFHIYEEIKKDDNFKWYEIIDGEKISRNNIDPSLTPDGLPTIETQLKKLQEIDNERQNLILSEDELDKKHKREMLQRIRCIALNSLDKDILSNPKNLNPNEKREFVKKVEELYILSENDVKKMFNEICHDSIFLPTANYSNYIVYDC